MSEIASTFIQPEFKPNAKKIESILKEVAKEKKEDSKEQVVEKEEETNNQTEVINMTKEVDLFFKSKPQDIKFLAEEFEKDEDSNFHIDIIYSMSNLRSKNYKIDEMDWVNVKIKAGRIIPALATTTAAIAGLQSLELVKIIQELSVDKIRNIFLNLAVPIMQASEPGEITKHILKKDPDLVVTEWDRWEYVIGKDDTPTLNKLFTHVYEKYGLFPKDCFAGKKALYSYVSYKGDDKKEQRENILNTDLRKVVDFIEEEYIDLLVTFTTTEESEEYLKDVPKIRIIIKK